MFDGGWVQEAIWVATLFSFLVVFELTRRSESRRMKLACATRAVEYPKIVQKAVGLRLSVESEGEATARPRSGS